MVESVPKYLLEKISLLYSNYNTGDFSFQDAITTFGHDERYTGLILSKLVKAGWIEKRRDAKNTRKKIYHIKNISEIVEEIGKRLQEEK